MFGVFVCIRNLTSSFLKVCRTHTHPLLPTSAYSYTCSWPSNVQQGVLQLQTSSNYIYNLFQLLIFLLALWFFFHRSYWQNFSTLGSLLLFPIAFVPYPMIFFCRFGAFLIARTFAISWWLRMGSGFSAQKSSTRQAHRDVHCGAQIIIIINECNIHILVRSRLADGLPPECVQLSTNDKQWKFAKWKKISRKCSAFGWYSTHHLVRHSTISSSGRMRHQCHGRPT